MQLVRFVDLVLYFLVFVCHPIGGLVKFRMKSDVCSFVDDSKMTDRRYERDIVLTIRMFPQHTHTTSHIYGKQGAQIRHTHGFYRV